MSSFVSDFFVIFSYIKGHTISNAPNYFILNYYFDSIKNSRNEYMNNINYFQ